jgi:hypothetical protein
MQGSELAFFTTQELIDEVLRRQTFCGVVVQSADEHRSAEWGAERTFRVRFNGNLDAPRAGRLLAAVSNYMDLMES